MILCYMLFFFFEIKKADSDQINVYVVYWRMIIYSLHVKRRQL